MGGTEFVSRAVAKFLISKDYVVDIFTRGQKQVDYKGVRNHLVGDRKNKKSLKQALGNRSYEYVVDVSAYTKEDVQLLTDVINRDILKKYVFCSTGGVYVPSDEIMAEDFERGENYNWLQYGLDKKEAEDYLIGLFEKDNFPFTSFRPTYIYGEGNNLYREYYFFDVISNGAIVPIPEGNTTTQFLYIDDLVRTFESALSSKPAIGQCYNITHSEILSWKDMIDVYREVLQKPVEIKEITQDMIKAYNIDRVRAFYPYRDVTYKLSTEKLKKDGLYVPQINLTEGLKLAYKIYQSKEHKLNDPGMNKVELLIK